MRALSGQVFAPGENVTLYWDSQPMNQTMTDANGSFFDVFVDVPAGGTLGSHLISAVETSNDTANSFFDVFIPALPLIGDINGDGKVSLADLVTIAVFYENTDPNMDPPGAAKPVQQASIGFPSIALMAIASLGVLKRRTRNRQKTSAR